MGGVRGGPVGSRGGEAEGGVGEMQALGGPSLALLVLILAVQTSLQAVSRS